MELFSAFLWLSESVIIFVSFLLIFYLNVYGSINKINLKIYNFKIIGVSFLLIFIFLYSYIPFFNKVFQFFPEYALIDDYYESLNNNIFNDLLGLFFSYYFVNFFEFIIIIFFLLIGSLICVNLNKINKFNKTFNYVDMFTVFDFFKDFTKFIFLRKQNLVDQEIHPSSARIFKKKIN
jgi:hypothetical protein